jgi:EAL domain-containing protein (putative c-di-GMP-specific phosphodiesterase class I)
MRWRHPEQGRLQPDDFIRIAEQTGMITPLTEFAIDRALSDWARHGARGLSIATNLSPQTLHDSSLPDRIRRILTRHNVDAAMLVLEITENVLMLDPERSTRCVSELHDLGLRIALDDFGTGYSSLSYLHRLPVDDLKIDRSFIAGLASGDDDALVRSIIELGHNLGLRVVAEGVENEDVRTRLRELGCDAAQGFHIHAPVPARDLEAWMAATDRARSGGYPVDFPADRR